MQEERFEKIVDLHKNLTSLLENSTTANLEAYQSLESDYKLLKVATEETIESSRKTLTEYVKERHRSTIMNMDTLIQGSKNDNLNSHQATLTLLKQMGEKIGIIQNSVIKEMSENKEFVRGFMNQFNESLTEVLVSLPDEGGNNGEVIEAIDEAIGNIYQNNEKINILGNSIRDLSDFMKNSYRNGKFSSSGDAKSNLVSLNTNMQPQGYSGFPLDLRDDIKLIKRNSLDMLRAVKK